MELGGEARECLIGEHHENPKTVEVRSTVTPVFAFSTLVALCGSLSVGYAVSLSFFHRLIFMHVSHKSSTNFYAGPI